MGDDVITLDTSALTLRSPDKMREIGFSGTAGEFLQLAASLLCHRADRDEFHEQMRRFADSMPKPGDAIYCDDGRGNGDKFAARVFIGSGFRESDGGKVRVVLVTVSPGERHDRIPTDDAAGVVDADHATWAPARILTKGEVMLRSSEAAEA